MRLIDGRKGGRAPHAGVDLRPRQRPQERQRAVDVPSPPDLAAHELVGMMGHQPRLPFAVPHLLPPVLPDARSIVMPYERGRGKTDLPAQSLQAPAHIDVVAGAQINRVEAADGEQRLPAERHVAAGHVLGNPVVQQDVCRPAGRAGDALGHPRVVGRYDARPPGPHHIRGQERLHQVRQPVGIGADIRIRVRHDLPGCGLQADIPGRAQPTVRHVNAPDAGMAGADGACVIGGAIVHQNDLDVGVRQALERGQTLIERVRGVVRADHDRDPRPRPLLGFRKRRRAEHALHCLKSRLGPAGAVDETERPVLDRGAATPPLVGPREGNGAAGALGERRAKLHGYQGGLAILTLT